MPIGKRNLLPLKSSALTISAKDKSSDLYISKISVSIDNFELSFVFLNENYSLKINQPLPKYFAYSFALSIAACFSCGISIKDCLSYISENFSLPPGRFSVFKGIKKTLVIDSSYNSSLEATIGAIEAVAAVAENRRKVGILGDMRELGTLSKIQHELLAKIIVKNLDSVVLIGPLMKKYVAPILDKNKFSYISFEGFSEAKKEILEMMRENDIILVKGSQNTLFLERAVEMLLENKDDSKKLCRRGEFWDRKRKESS